ncbi:telomere repeats-binding bouquet formation protein 1 isoform X2 [Esox lucius]|uniref:telomere repeats-binding bouquet formation protein 1 isoform X2 n=1 Tax=Esox lucius TaxID=8010 RepID=UPI00147780CE|nr:telomere repeats-binding bouquet formation protein 1 isoform X2 [Esox lucius]
MEIDVSSIHKGNDYNATKTDLCLLLECLKYQMKCPDSQKQALLTIYSICQQREENVDSFREMGGVVFVYNLSKSSCHSEVRETALFTLGMLAEVNVYCKQALCRRETFRDLAECLVQQGSPLTQRRVAVYLLSVLVANNRSGQAFAQTSGCLDILLDLFRTSFPLSDEAAVKTANVTQLFQVWSSVSSALCGCVNNPQNEESQRICASAFPFVKAWLQQLSHPRAEMVQPICSFIAMTVANNYCVQESFSAVGGLKTLTCTLIRLASDVTHSPPACQLSVTLTKTLSACISDNPMLASSLAGYGLVPHLHSLLSSPLLDPRDRLVVILALGHCTEASEEHQSQLLECGGLSVIITLLTQSGSPELSKAAAFVLHSCRQAAGCLRGAAHVESPGQGGDVEGYRQSARDMLRRIKQLERHQAQGAVEDTLNAPGQPLQSPLPPSPSSLLPPCPFSAPCWDRRGVADRRWTGERDHERGEEGGEGVGISCERTPLREVPGGQERVMYGDPESPALTQLTRRVRGCERGQRNQVEDQEEDLSTYKEPDLRERVRRRIFQAGEEAQKPSPSRMGRGEERRNPREESHRAGYRNIRADPETDGDWVAKRGNALRGNAKTTAEGTHAHAQTESCADPPPGMGEQAHTLSGRCQGKRPALSTMEGALIQPGGDSQVFKCPAPISVQPGMSRPKTLLDDEDALFVCSELLDSEISTILETSATTRNPTSRCSGCVLRFGEVTSWWFPVLQRSCPHSCDLHRVLQQVTHAHTQRLRDHRRRDACAAEQRDTRPHTLTLGLRKGETQGEGKRPRYQCSDVSLTPLRKSGPNAGISLTPLCGGGLSRVTSRGQERGDRHPRGMSVMTFLLQQTELSNSKTKESEMTNDERRERRNFSSDEESYLCHGVQRFGPSWNAILWAYPFKPGRTNVDLAKKYKRMQFKA